MFYFYIYFFFFRQPAFDGLCLSGSLPCIHVNTDVSNFTLRQINLCVCVCVSLISEFDAHVMDAAINEWRQQLRTCVCASFLISFTTRVYNVL